MDAMFVIPGISVGLTYQNFLPENQMLDAIISSRPSSSFAQICSESKKIDMAKDSIFDSSVFVHFLVQKMPKECKRTLNSTRMWVGFGLCLNNSPTAMISL
jgi:hypothetical protein